MRNLKASYDVLKRYGKNLQPTRGFNFTGGEYSKSKADETPNYPFRALLNCRGYAIQMLYYLKVNLLKRVILLYSEEGNFIEHSPTTYKKAIF